MGSSNAEMEQHMDWPVVTLGDVADIRSGVTLGRKLRGSTIRVPYLRVANVQDGRLNLHTVKEIDVLADEVGKWLLQPGDILLTEGGDWDKLGRGTVWHGEIGNCIHQNHIFRVRVKPSDFDPHFLAALIASPYGKSYFQAASKQTTNLASINQSQLKALKVFRPSLPEQRHIISRIEKLSARIERARELRQEAAEEAISAVNNAKAELIDGLPDATLPLSALLREDSQNGLSPRPSNIPPGFPILRISAATTRQDARVNESDYKYLELEGRDIDKYTVEPGDLLACRFNGNLHFVGRFALYTGYLGLRHVYPDKLIRFRVDTNKVLPAFVLYAMNSPQRRASIESRCSTTAGNIGISAAILKTIPLPVPSLIEQKRIVAYLDELDAKAAALRQLQTNSASDLDALLPTVLAQAFKGEL